MKRRMNFWALRRRYSRLSGGKTAPLKRYRQWTLRTMPSKGGGYGRSTLHTVRIYDQRGMFRENATSTVSDKVALSRAMAIVDAEMGD